MRIGRYDNPYKCVSFDAISPRVRQEPVTLEAADGGLSSGVLYTTTRHRTVVCFMHPKADMSRHYAIPGIVDAGFAAFGQNSRWLNNDELCVHEALLLDVAAGIQHLRAIGFEHIILVGNSGGGSLYGLYQAQATTSPPGRLTHTPAGDPLDLNEYDLPPADGFIHLAAHLGEGRILMSMIDPSVTDEADPLSCDPALDPFNPDNGFHQPPASSHYAPRAGVPGLWRALAVAGDHRRSSDRDQDPRAPGSRGGAAAAGGGGSADMAAGVRALLGGLSWGEAGRLRAGSVDAELRPQCVRNRLLTGLAPLG